MVTSVDKFFISLKDQFLHHLEIPTFDTVKTIKSKTPVDFVPAESKKAKQQVKQRDKSSFENCLNENLLCTEWRIKNQSDKASFCR